MTKFDYDIYDGYSDKIPKPLPRQLVHKIPVVANIVPVGEDMFTELDIDELIQNNNTMRAFIKYRQSKLDIIDNFMDILDEIRRDSY